MNMPQTKRVYYYTGRRWAMKSLWERRLKIAQYADVNDPFELIPFDLTGRKSRDFWTKKATRFLEGKHGILCFSEDWRTTLMWSHYGEKHSGMCLGFDVPIGLAEPVTYVDKLLTDPADPKKELRGTSQRVLESALRFKYSGWSYEREWRLRARLPSPEEGLYYKEFDDDLHLREVIIGVRCPLSTDDVAKAVSNPPLDVEIFKAQTAHDEFAVSRHQEIPHRTVAGFRARLARARDVFHDDLPDEESTEQD
jgi:hypothetical protein